MFHYVCPLRELSVVTLALGRKCLLFSECLCGFCSPIHLTNIIVNFADDTTIVGLISNNTETVYRDDKLVPSK